MTSIATTTGVGDTSPLDASADDTTTTTSVTATTEPLSSGPAESSTSAADATSEEQVANLVYDDFVRTILAP